MFQIIGLLFIYILSGFWLNYNLIKEKTIKMPSYLSSIVFIILCLPLIILNNSWHMALSIFFLICIYIEILGFSYNTELKKRIFKTGFFLGILILIDSSFLFFLTLIIGALIYYNHIFWRYFVIQLIGLIYPLGLYAILQRFANMSLNFQSTIDLKLFYTDPLLMAVLSILLTLSLKELYTNSYKKTEKSKKGFNLIYVISILIILQAIVLNSLKFIHLLSLPITIIIANYLIYLRHKKFQTFLLGLLLIIFSIKIFI